MKDALIFLLRLIAFSLPLFLFATFSMDLTPVQHVVSSQAAWALRMMGYDVAENGLILSVGSGASFTFLIGTDCTGLKPMLAYLALVLAAMGTGLRRKALGLAIGLPMVYAGNIARIIAVVLIERAYGLKAAMVFHDWLWQAGLISLVLAVWLVWLRWDAIQKALKKIGGARPGKAARKAAGSSKKTPP